MSDTNNAPQSVNSIESTETVENTTESSLNSGESSVVENQQNSIETKPLTKAEEKALKKKLKLKIDGKEIEEEVDLEDDDYLTKQLQLAKVAQKRMSEYAQLEKEIEQFLKELKKNPKKVLSDPNIGIDVKQFVNSFIEEEIENSKKSPEQIEREKLENELKALKEEREREKEELRNKELQMLQEQEVQRYDTLITDSLSKSDLPKSPYVVKKMADYMLLGLKEGYDITPDDVLPLVREDLMGDLKEMFALMPVEVIEKIVGKDIINTIRKKKVTNVQQVPPKPINKAITDVGVSKTQENKEVKKKTIKELWGI